jgi:nicotinamidase/pyrazinamidase
MAGQQALIVVDVQNDFLPGGALAVPHGDEVIPVLNGYLAEFEQQQLPIFATRDWHPPNHCSFRTQGGPWPVHCVVGTPGAEFPVALDLPPSAIVVSKPSTPDKETYSAFEGTDLEQQLREASVESLYVGGLATDYCVLNTVKGALLRGFQVRLLRKAIRPVNVEPKDGEKAEKEMARLGALLVD